VHVTEAIVQALADGGVEYVFGMPGGYTGGIFEALFEHPTIKVVQVREESIGSTMAEAYGRLTGKPVVVMGQGEWIAGNAGQGFLEALLGASPMLILTEMSDNGPLSHHAPYQGGTGDYGGWDAIRALEGVTKRVLTSHHPAQAVQQVQLALKHALTGQPGPVAVVFHGDALRGPVGPDSQPRLYDTKAYLPGRSAALDQAAVDAAAAALRGARRPVIIAGNGVRVGQAKAQLAAFAQAVDAPVATTASGKGVFPEVHPAGAGVMGTFGVPTANHLIGDADVIVAVGTKLGPVDTADENRGLIDPSRQVLIQLEREVLNASWTFPVDHTLVGEAALLLDALRSAHGADVSAREATAAARVAAIHDEHGEPVTDDFTADVLPFMPQRLISILQELVPEDAIVTADAGENRLFMMHWYRTKPSGDYLQPAAGGGMGYSVPAGLGAKLAFPSKPVLSVVGDGGFAMSLHALMTAVQAKLPTTVLVLNNGALGWVLHGMGPKAVGASFDAFDHAAIARAIGCEATKVESVEQLRDALKTIGTLDRPHVIDVPMSLAVSFKDTVQPLASDRWKRSE
jgi:acetolactate synthase-1/2/3 large subunit